VSLRPLLLLLTPLLLLQGTALASTEAAEKRLHSAVDEVLAVADHAPNNSSLATSLRPILLNYISFDAMTRRAVGPGWRQFTPDQQKKAVQLFATLIIRTYSAKFTPGEHPVIKFKAATSPAPGRVEVPTTLLYQGSHYEVVYRLEEAEGWRITDVVIEGVSLIANYRTQFDAQFKKGGADAVISALTQSVNAPQ
jgi:phospholipid transport system substrate-binding protein